MTEIAVVLILALVFLGPKKLPELASGLGKMIREIKKVTAGVKEEIQLDENIRKPFDELREAIQLPAEELKRRDEWKAEWERRQQEEAAQAAIDAAKPPEGDGAETDTTNVTSESSSTSDPFANTVYAGENNADATMISPAPTSDKTIAAPSPLHLEPTLAASAHASGPAPVPGPAPVAAPAPVAPPAAVLPPAPRLPTAPPVGAVATGGRTMMGVMPSAAVPGSPVAAAPSRPTPPPPPPAASRLPAPKVPARSVPAPLPDDEPGDDKKPA